MKGWLFSHPPPYGIVLVLWSSRLLFRIIRIDFTSCLLNLFLRQVRCYLFCFLNEIRAIKFVKCPKALHVPANITTCEDNQTAWNSRSPWTLRSSSAVWISMVITKVGREKFACHVEDKKLYRWTKLEQSIFFFVFNLFIYWFILLQLISVSPLGGYTPLLQFWPFYKGIIIIIRA